MTCYRTLAPKAFNPGNTISREDSLRGRGVCASSVLSRGSFLLRFFLQADVVSRQRLRRRRRGLLREVEFVKGVSNPGAVVPGELEPGAFGNGCTVPREISKRYKCVKTIPHVEKLSICNILYG